MRNEHSCCGWNNSDRYDVFDMQKKKKKKFSFSYSLSLFHIHLTFGSCYQYSLNAWLVDKNISFLSLSIYTHLCFAFLLVLVDFNSNTKSTPFSHQLFSPNSFLNYSKSDRRTSSPIEHHQHQQSNEDNEEITTDDNDDYLDEDSCNR